MTSILALMAFDGRWRKTGVTPRSHHNRPSTGPTYFKQPLSGVPAYAMALPICLSPAASFTPTGTDYLPTALPAHSGHTQSHTINQPGGTLQPAASHQHFTQAEAPQRPPFRRLQSRQSIWQLSVTVRPPSCHGVIWSPSMPDRSKCRPHEGQMPC